MADTGRQVCFGQKNSKRGSFLSGGSKMYESMVTDRSNTHMLMDLKTFRKANSIQLMQLNHNPSVTDALPKNRGQYTHRSYIQLPSTGGSQSSNCSLFDQSNMSWNFPLHLFSSS